MKPGGGAAKGAAFETATCRKLSLWITHGKRADTLERNVASGGRFTRHRKTGNKALLGTGGDIMAAHADAFDFIARFHVECKFYRDIGITAFFLDDGQSSFLWKVYRQAEADAAHANVMPLVVARQNRFPTLLLMPGPLGEFVPVKGHLLHGGAIYVCKFETFLERCNVHKLIDAAKQLMGPT